MLAALLLDVAGVEHDAIVADYALTADRIEAVFGRLRGAEWFARLAEDVPAFVFDAQASTMEKFLATLTERWGDAAGYLQSAGSPRHASTWRADCCGERGASSRSGGAVGLLGRDARSTR